MISRVRQCYHDITSTRVKDNVQDFPPCRSVSWDQHREELPFRRTHRATKASSDVTMAGVLSRILSLGRKVMADVGPVGIYSLHVTNFQNKFLNILYIASVSVSFQILLEVVSDEMQQKCSFRRICWLEWTLKCLYMEPHNEP